MELSKVAEVTNAWRLICACAIASGRTTKRARSAKLIWYTAGDGYDVQERRRELVQIGDVIAS